MKRRSKGFGLERSLLALLFFLVFILFLGAGKSLGTKAWVWLRAAYLHNAVFYLPKQADSVKVDLASVGLRAKRPDVLYCYAGLNFALKVQVSNASRFTVGSDSAGQALGVQPPVNLGHKWYQGSGEILLSEGPRYFLSPPLPPSGPAGPSLSNLLLPLNCPNQIGHYSLSIELVQEGVAWQSDISNDTQYLAMVPLQVLALDEGGLVKNMSGLLEVEKVNSLQNQPLPDSILKAFALGVRLLEASILSPSVGNKTYLVSEAGSQYPMVWARDMATISEALNELWRPALLSSQHWSELFWRFQSPAGEIPDWVTIQRTVEGEWFGKNSVTSDQELWLLDAIFASLDAQLLNPQWLKEETKGKAHSQRMQDAAAWLIKERFSVKDGCLWSGHTVDWGDVGLVGRDNMSATKLGEGGGRVCSTYTQALFLRVATRFGHFAKQYPAMFEREFLEHLQVHTTIIASFARRELWQEKEGFFRIHKHIEEPNKEFVHTDQGFAVGGQILAWQAGLLSENQLARVCRNILHRQKKYHMSTISGVLLPPYSAGLYEHPSMQPYSYQNGGQWDWWGAQAVALLYRCQSAAGEKALLEIAEKVVHNKTFYEWDQASGEAGAGPHFRAGAAAFVSAVLEIYGKPKVARD